MKSGWERQKDGRWTKDGKVTEQGTYQELLQKKGAFAEFLVEYMTEQEDDLGEDLKQQLQEVVSDKDLSKALSRINSVEGKDKERSISVSNSEKMNSKKCLGRGQSFWEFEKYLQVSFFVYGKIYFLCGRKNSFENMRIQENK